MNEATRIGHLLYFTSEEFYRVAVGEIVGDNGNFLYVLKI